MVTQLLQEGPGECYERRYRFGWTVFDFKRKHKRFTRQNVRAERWTSRRTDAVVLGNPRLNTISLTIASIALPIYCRRVMLLKAQLYQTERQLLLLQDGMARRTSTLWEAENIMKVRKCLRRRDRILKFLAPITFQSIFRLFFLPLSPLPSGCEISIAVVGYWRRLLCLTGSRDSTRSTLPAHRGRGESESGALPSTAARRRGRQIPTAGHS